MKIILNKVFDEERSLYNLKNTKLDGVLFEGPKDGESVLKEARNIEVYNTTFNLRYPLWHVKKAKLDNCKFLTNSRASIWYAINFDIANCQVNAVKAIRECKNINIINSIFESIEFGWKSKNISIKESSISGEYSFLESKDVNLDNVNFSGKYSFQYMKNLNIKNSNLKAKDAFWHSKNIYIENSYIEGEYLAWFSNNITLVNCTIKGTQPFCYTKNLTLINCKMIDTDLAFEYSSVNAEIKGKVLSIKNPKSGKIIVEEVDDIILEDSIMKNHCEIIVRNK